MHTSMAAAAARGCDALLFPNVPAKAWAKMSPATAAVENLGRLLPTHAAACAQQGTELCPADEAMTSWPCPRCNFISPTRRGGAKHCKCSNCGADTLRDVGAGAGSIARRNAVLRLESRAALRLKAAAARPAMPR